MSAKRMESRERGVIDQGDWMELFARVKQVISSATSQDRVGSGAMLAAGVLIARAVRNGSGNRRRAAGQLLAGAILLGFGLRRRRSSERTPASERSGAAPDDEPTKVSDDAHAARERHDVMHQSEPNPRGTADDAPEGAGTGADEGSIRFTEEQEAAPQQEPRLDDAPEDPRYEDEAGVEVDLSEAAMADEASEATGPDPEQAQPTQTEDTEPESSPPEDASHMEADVADENDPASGSDADRDVEGGEADDPESEETAETGSDKGGSGG